MQGQTFQWLTCSVYVIFGHEKKCLYLFFVHVFQFDGRQIYRFIMQTVSQISRGSVHQTVGLKLLLKLFIILHRRCFNGNFSFNETLEVFLFEFPVKSLRLPKGLFTMSVYNCNVANKWQPFILLVLFTLINVKHQRKIANVIVHCELAQYKKNISPSGKPSHQCDRDTYHCSTKDCLVCLMFTSSQMTSWMNS